MPAQATCQEERGSANRYFVQNLYFQALLLQMLLVSGGWTGDVRLDSTEIFDPDLGSWSAEAALPMKYGINGLKSATIDNRVFIFGKAFFAT